MLHAHSHAHAHTHWGNIGAIGYTYRMRMCTHHSLVRTHLSAHYSTVPNLLTTLSQYTLSQYTHSLLTIYRTHNWLLTLTCYSLTTVLTTVNILYSRHYSPIHYLRPLSSYSLPYVTTHYLPLTSYHTHHAPLTCHFYTLYSH